MSRDAQVYDLGEVRRHKPAAQGPGPHRSPAGPAPLSAGATAPSAARAFRPPAAPRQPAPRGAPAGAAAPHRAAVTVPRPSAVAASLALVVPGASHLLERRVGLGLLYASATGFLLALGWAVVTTSDRIAATLPLLGTPPAAAAWVLEAAFVLVAALHLASLAAATAPSPTVRRPVPRLVAVLASALLPGWGQALKGRRVRALAFVGALWCLAGVWLVLSAPAARIMDVLGLFVPETLRLFVLPIARYAGPVLVWLVAVYDAAVVEDW